MSRYVIEQGVFEGAKTYILKDTNLGLSLTVLPQLGSHIISFRSDELGVEFIKGPQSLEQRTTSFGFPILMPPNRIEGGRFKFGGKEYVFDQNERGRQNHIHGLVHDKPWEVKSVGANSNDGAWIETVIRSIAVPDILRQFPHDFELSVKYVLKNGELEIVTRCVNNGEDEMPFGIGFHPYFKAPLSEDSSKAECCLKVPAGKIWELIECIPTGRLLGLEGSTKDLKDGVALEAVLLDDIYTDLEFDEEGSTCEYVDRGAGVGLRYTADRQFLHWVIYSGKTLDSDFLCLEPYTWVTNAPNLDMPPSLTGFRILSPKAEFVGRMLISSFTLHT